jgi:hypothetical protein
MLAAIACVFVLGACGGSSDPQPAAPTPIATVAETVTPAAAPAKKFNLFDG